MPERTVRYNDSPIVEETVIAGGPYVQSVNELEDFPQTTLVPQNELKPNIPNIFSLPSEELPTVWIQDLEIEKVPKDVYVSKCDVGGSGGHVEVAGPVEGTFAEHILRFNRYDGNKPLFLSLIIDHTGDDVAVKGVIPRDVAERHLGVIDELVFDAFWKAAEKAKELGQYGPGQDLKSDAFTGNMHGLGPARVTLPLPLHPENSSQVVLIATSDKTEPAVFNHLAAGAYMNPRFNTGLLVAESNMKNGYVFEIVDLDTKTLAMEQGISPNDEEAINKRMGELGQEERYIVFNTPEESIDVSRLLLDTSRYVVTRIFSRDENGEPGKLGYVVSAERLHNIETPKGFVYGGKDDPTAAMLAQGDWPAPGEITSVFANTPLVAGNCRGGHWLHLYPAPINFPTTFWSGPIVSAITLSINTHTGRIGSISDQFPIGSPWDQYRLDAANKMRDHRAAHGFLQPGTLPAKDQEYHPGLNQAKAKFAHRWQTRKPA